MKMLCVTFLLVLVCQNVIVSQTKTLTFQPEYLGEKIHNNTWYVTKNGDSVLFKKIRFYITNVSFKLDNGENYKVANSNYLIDAFNPESLSRVLKSFPESKLVESITFTLGVPEQLNEAGALSGDLDPINGMYWAWQSGYINLKIEGVSPVCQTRKNKFIYHLGGYKKPYSTARELSFKINSTNNSLIIKVDIAKFINEIDIKSKHSLMIPGEEAMKLIEVSTKMFSVE